MIRGPEGYPIDAVADLVHRKVTEYKVDRWLAGSQLKTDRPSLAELESCGYRVIKDDDR